jgi:hypothetical protein
MHDLDFQYQPLAHDSKERLLALVTLVGSMKVAQRSGHDSRLTHSSRPLQLCHPLREELR